MLSKYKYWLLGFIGLSVLAAIFFMAGQGPGSSLNLQGSVNGIPIDKWEKIEDLNFRYEQKGKEENSSNVQKNSRNQVNQSEVQKKLINQFKKDIKPSEVNLGNYGKRLPEIENLRRNPQIDIDPSRLRREGEVKVYSNYPDCTEETPSNLCHAVTNKQVINYTDTPFEFSRIGDFRICYEEASRGQSVVINSLNFSLVSDGGNLVRATVNGQTFNFNHSWSGTVATSFLENPIILNNGNCINAVLEAKKTLEYDTSSISSQLINVDIVNNMNVNYNPDNHDSFGSYLIYEDNRTLNLNRSNYRGVETALLASDFPGATVSTLGICSYDGGSGQIENLNFKLKTNPEFRGSFESILSVSRYNYRTQRSEGQESSITLTNDANINLESIINIGSVDCYDVKISIDNEQDVPEGLEWLVVELEDFTQTEGVTYRYYNRETRETFINEEIAPIVWTKYLVNDPANSNLLSYRFRKPRSNRSVNFIQDLSSTNCDSSLSATSDPACKFMYLQEGYLGNFSRQLSETGGRIRFNQITFDINSTNLGVFNAKFAISNGDNDPQFSEIVTIQPGENNIVLDLSGVEPLDYVPYIWAEVDNSTIRRTAQSFFDYGELDISVTDIDADVNFDTDGILNDFVPFTEIYIEGVNPPGSGGNEILQPLPAGTGILGVDEPKAYVNSYDTGIVRVSLAELSNNNRALGFFSGHIESLNFDGRIQTITFNHDIDKNTVPGEALILRVGNTSIIPSQWVQNQSVTFTFAEGDRPFISQTNSKNINLELVNPDPELAEDRTPTSFRLTNVDIEVDRSSPAELFEWLVSGFDGSLNPIRLADNELSGPLTIITP